MVTLRRIFGALTLLALAACGGGGGGSATSTFQIKGTAATGAAMADATISVKDSKDVSYSCSEKTDISGKYSCNVSGTAVPPFLVTSQIGVNESTKMKSVVLDAKVGVPATALITPLSNALIELELSGKSLKDLDTTKLNARKKQITEALSNVIAEAGLTKDSFDFLTDSSFAANTGKGMDRLLDNISVKNTSDSSQKTTFDIALKNNTDANEKATLDSTEATSVKKNVTSKDSSAIRSVNPAPSTNNTIDSFKGTYTVNVTFYSNNGDGTFVPPETKTVTFTVASDYKITCSGNDNLKDCSGTLTYDNNVATITVTNSSGTSSTTIKGSIDNFFKVTATLSSKDTSNNNTTTGYVVGWQNANSPSKPLSYFAATYSISVPKIVWKKGDNNTIIEDTEISSQILATKVDGNITIDSDGKVSSCKIGSITNCTGSLVLKNTSGSGASFTISANDSEIGSSSDTSTFWVTFTGSVDNSKSISGSVSGKKKTGYKLNGDFTGSPKT